MTIKRGEIYFVNLNPIKGKEQSGIKNQKSQILMKLPKLLKKLFVLVKKWN